MDICCISIVFFVQVENQTSYFLILHFWGVGEEKEIYLRIFKNNVENNTKPQESQGYDNNCSKAASLTEKDRGGEQI